MPDFLWWDSAGLAVFVKVEIIGAAGAGNGSCCVKWLELTRIMWRILCANSDYSLALSPVIKPSSSAEQISPPIIFPSQTMRFIIILSSVFPLSSV